MFAAIVRFRRPLPRGLAWSLLFVAVLMQTACTTSTPQSSSDAKPTVTRASGTPSAAARATASPGAAAEARPSPSPSPGTVAAIEIIDATMADATPWVMLRLTGGEPQIVSGWRLEVGDKAATIPGNAVVQPGETLTLHAGDGPSSDREIFLGPDSEAVALAAAPGARVRLVNATGTVAAETTVPRY